MGILVISFGLGSGFPRSYYWIAQGIGATIFVYVLRWIYTSPPRWKKKHKS